MNEQPSRNIATVVISSTALDLPEYRCEAESACKSLRCLPLMMEDMGSKNADAVGASLQLVDDADLYLGIIAWRYGYVPQGETRSVTEMEYQRAADSGKARLMFVMSDEVPLAAQARRRGCWSAAPEGL